MSTYINIKYIITVQQINIKSTQYENVIKLNESWVEE